jgi:5'-nucleotidase
LTTVRKQVLATASQDLIRGANSGPGPLVADSMLAAVPRAQVAILNYGGVRKDVLQGAISVGDVLEVMPFANSLVLVDLTGAELQSALEEDLDFLLTKYGNHNSTALPYVAGVRFSVTPSAGKGDKVGALKVQGADGTYLPIDPTATYRTVVNAFVASGGDGFTAIKHAKGFRSDTGIIDSDAFRDHLQALGTVQNPTTPRIFLAPAA